MLRTRWPKIVAGPEPPDKWGELARVVGKTIIGVEIGRPERGRWEASTEQLVLYFNDRTALCIAIGSNAQDIIQQVRPHGVRLSLADFCTELLLLWSADDGDPTAAAGPAGSPD